jgi:hypothetical protein
MSRLRTINYAGLAVVNFIVLSFWGLALRYMQLADLPFNYQFLLHAHSHFAFSGWMFLTIAYLVARICCAGQLSAGFRNLLLMAQVSAWGMLVSFSLQGYKAVAISFSTLFVLAGFRFAYLVFRSPVFRARVNAPARLLIHSALVFLCVSALGPFTLGPLAALGLKASPWYQDAIYFYLHFQMNGFMELSALGLFAATLPLNSFRHNDRRWFRLFIISALPLYFIFTLWARPGPLVGMLAAFGAALNLLSWLVILFRFRNYGGFLSFLQKAALLALTIKCVLQLAICVPGIGDWTFLNRNLIIGYIHLLTLGIVMPLLIAQLGGINVLRTGAFFSGLKFAYVILVVTYLALLFLQPLLAIWGISIPLYQHLLFWLCAAFLGFGIGLLVLVKKINVRI